jgi:hypothetical protein
MAALSSLPEKKGTCLCHASAHGKEVFAVRWHETARQRMAAWQRMKKNERQRPLDEKDPSGRTVKKMSMAKPYQGARQSR